MPGRRRFIKEAGTAALSLTILRPGLVRGTQANSRIRLGIVGCGGRGTWIADLFRKHGGFEVCAGADYFAALRLRGLLARDIDKEWSQLPPDHRLHSFLLLGNQAPRR